MDEVDLWTTSPFQSCILRETSLMGHSILRSIVRRVFMPTPIRMAGATRLEPAASTGCRAAWRCGDGIVDSLLDIRVIRKVLVTLTARLYGAHSRDYIPLRRKSVLPWHYGSIHWADLRGDQGPSALCNPRDSQKSRFERSRCDSHLEKQLTFWNEPTFRATEHRCSKVAPTKMLGGMLTADLQSPESRFFLWRS